MRRGSSNKYNPNPVALKKQNDTAKKYSYYADHFDINNKKENEDVKDVKAPENKKEEPLSTEIKAPTKAAVKKNTLKPTKSRETTSKEQSSLTQVNKGKTKEEKDKEKDKDKEK